MALLHISFFSKTLMRTIPLSVYLPSDAVDFNNQYLSEGPYKALVLLHGVLGSDQDWVNQTRILRYAKEKNLVLIMPSGENHFYVDQPWNYTNYGEFIGVELPEISRRMFPISRKREDLGIAGLSMGGYGALRNGIKYHDTFSVIGAFSGAIKKQALPLEEIPEAPFFLRKSFLEAVFKDEETFVAEGNQLYHAIQTMERKDALSVFMACGTEDWLLEDNRSYNSFLKEQGVSLTYTEHAGGHEWDFWDWAMKQFLDWWIPEDADQGVSSGNVKS